ncbi:MAG: DNA-binding protein WhiA [Provencibacterium sp.]|nr:DNA-binding protein WhiA [Provencibacterium sp.]
MSFSSVLKKEICGNRPFIYAHKQAILFGMLLGARSCAPESILLYTENRWVSRLFAELIYELAEIKTSVTSTEQILGDDRRLYEIRVDTAEDRKAVLAYLAPVRQHFFGCMPDNQKNQEFLRGVLCGAFLSCANISDPQKSYHLEFVAHAETAQQGLCTLLDKLDMRFRKTTRKGIPILYVKNSEEIEDVLTLLGAGKSALEVMNVKIYKDMRNRVNRVTNCETANIDRTVLASSQQNAQIRLIERTVGLEALPENLQQIARLRLENPDMPLSELAAALTPPVSRSGAHYRLRQIAGFAEKLQTEERKTTRQ